LKEEMEKAAGIPNELRERLQQAPLTVWQREGREEISGGWGAGA
jgi:hypothetical protein